MKLLGIRFDDLTKEELFDKIDRLIDEKNNSYLVTPNIRYIGQYYEDQDIRNAIDGACIRIPDGKGIELIGRLFKKKFKRVIGGRKLFYELLEYYQNKETKIFLFGSKNDDAKKAKKQIEKMYPGINIAGALSPSMGFLNKSDEVQYINKIILEVNPDILIVGLGCPTGIKWLAENIINFKGIFALEIGSSIDVLAGVRKNPPDILFNIGLAWLIRIFENPRIFISRIIRDVFRIIPIIYSELRLRK